MDDREIIESLKRLDPKKAPSRMDGKVLTAAEKAVPKAAAPPRLIFRWSAWAGAAAILLASLLLFLTLDAEQETSASKEEAASAARPSQEALAARAKLLELKLARLKRLAAFTMNEKRYADDLNGLDRKLRDIDRIFLSIEPTEKFIKHRLKNPNGGKSDEEGFNIRRLPFDPDPDRLRAARKPC